MSADYLESIGVQVLGGYVSPVNDGYKKKGDFIFSILFIMSLNLHFSQYTPYFSQFTIICFSNIDKKGLLSNKHRINMLQLAVKSSNFIMVDEWESIQPEWQTTINVCSSELFTSLNLWITLFKDALRFFVFYA
jgi:nicotinic acid mononucleotide adenylyltransferase